MQQADQLVEVLEHAASTLEHALREMHAESRVQELALGAALLTPRRLRGIGAMVEMGLAYEAQALCRGVIELAINLGWVGDDEDRALRVQLRGPRDQLKFFRKASAAGLLVAADTFKTLEREIAKMDAGRSLSDLPNLAERARETRLFSQEQATDLYLLPFARMSAVVHMDWIHVAHVAEGQDFVRLLLEDTVAGTMFVVGAIARAFTSIAALESLCCDLQGALRRSEVDAVD